MPHTTDEAIELLLFYTGLQVAATIGDADGFVVDCETCDKAERQSGYDTQINACVPQDVAALRALHPGTRIICRVNNRPDRMTHEIGEAIAAGADEVLVPMVESVGVIEAAFDATAGRAGVGMMIETEWAVAHARELARLPLSRVFVGLHDLAIQRRSRHLFENVRNGTVARIRDHFRATRFGFGGLTLPDRGSPIPCRLLMSELARLDTDFTFLRRSFYRDVPDAGLGPKEAIQRIRTAWDAMRSRPPIAVQADHDELWRAFDRVIPFPQS